MSLVMPKPDEGVLARRQALAEALREIVPGEGVIDQAEELKAYETDGLTAYSQLPLLVVLGLFTRLASLGMIGFILVMTLVDLAFHGLKPEIVGTLFDNRADGLWDRRLLWIFLLAVLVLKGPGPVSLDRLLGRLRQRRQAGGALTRPEGSPRGS